MTKKNLLIVVVMATMVAAGAFAQVDPFFPPNPATIGRGGSFTADAQGYNAFFYNPAGFAGKNEFTLLSVNMYAVMDRRLLDAIWKVAVAQQQLDFSAYTKGIQSRDTAGSLQSLLDASKFYTDALAILTPEQVQTKVQGSVFQAEMASLSSQGLLVPGVDLSKITSYEQAVAALDPKILANPALLAATLDTFTNILIYGVAGEYNAAAKSTLTAALDSALAEAASVLPKGNLDLGAAVGMAWTGSGIGIGVFSQADITMRTPSKVGSRAGTILDAKGRAMWNVTLAAGFAFDLIDGIKLGVALRPTILSYGDFSPLGIMSIVSKASPTPQQIFSAVVPAGAYKTFYIGVDVGTLIKIEDFTIGITLKDLIPYKLKYYQYKDYNAFLESMPFKSGTNAVADSEGLYFIPPFKINAGIQWHPDLKEGAKLFDIKAGVDMFDVLGFIRYAANVAKNDASILVDEYNFLDMFGIGAEMKFFDFLSVRGGFYKRTATVGLGFRLLFVDLNVAGLFRGLDLSEGTKTPGFTEAGVSLELALRF